MCQKLGTDYFGPQTGVPCLVINVCTILMCHKAALEEENLAYPGRVRTKILPFRQNSFPHDRILLEVMQYQPHLGSYAFYELKKFLRPLAPILEPKLIDELAKRKNEINYFYFTSFIHLCFGVKDQMRD